MGALGCGALATAGAWAARKAVAAASSAVLGVSFTPSPAIALAVANVLVVMTTTLTHWGQHVFTASWVRREDLATFGTCNGAVNVLVNTIAVQISGVLIKRVFGGNYGVGFAIGAIICAIGGWCPHQVAQHPTKRGHFDLPKRHGASRSLGCQQAANQFCCT